MSLSWNAHGCPAKLLKSTQNGNPATMPRPRGLEPYFFIELHFVMFC